MSNPVIQREFFGILRSPKALSIMLVLTGVFSLAVLMRWPASGSVDLSGSKSLEVFRVFGYGLVAGVIFLVPAFPATSIVNEKNAGTLALLLNSPLSALKIYLGKISGVLLFSLLVLMCSLPASVACYAMGGISLTNHLGLLYLILALMILQYATLGMLISSYVSTSDAGVRITYSAVLGFFFLSLVPAILLRGTGVSGLPVQIAGWIRYLSPLPAVMNVLGHSSVGSSGLQESANYSLNFVIVGVVTSIVFAGWTLSRLNYRIFDGSREQGVMTDERGFMARALRRFVYIIDPQRRKPGIPWYLNPVMVKEFRSRRFGRTQWLLRLIALCALVSMILTIMAANSGTAWGIDTIGGMLIGFQAILIVVLTPSLTSGLISGERDSGSWDLLRMTPLSTFKILRGKIFSVLWTLALVMIATLPGYSMLTMITPMLQLQVNVVMTCLVWTVIYAVAVSAAVGCLFRTTAVSTSVTYVVVTAVFLFPFLVWLGLESPFGHTTVETVLLASPIAAALSVMETPGFSQFTLLPAAWWVAAAVSMVMFSILGFRVWQLTRAM